MHLAFDICQGIGIAAAVGIRPFLPTLAVGALAAGDVQIDFKHTDYSFLQSAPFLLGIVVAAIAVALLERRSAGEPAQRGPVFAVFAAVMVALGALLFAGALSQHHHDGSVGLVAGVACAIIGIVATRPLFHRVRRRLGADATGSLAAYGEGAALALAVLSAVAPPLGPVGLLALLWLLYASRRREGQKYAGLRILR